MSFEVIDNGIRVGLFLLFALFSLIHGIRKQDRRFWILSGCYACFSMGTLYYLIYLVIMGKVPQVFYVSEIAWMASYLFLLALCLIVTGKCQKRHSIVACVLTATEVAVVIGKRIFGPSYPFSIIFAMVIGVIFYHAVLDVQENRRGISFSMIGLIVWQLLLYIVSEHIRDYTQFNLYFVVDFLLMATMCSLFFWLKKEERE